MAKTKLSDYDLVTEQSPHIFEPWSVQWKMLQVVIALLLPTIAGTVLFGPRVLLHVAIGVFVTVTVEFIYEKVVRDRYTINDLSAVITGMLVALSMPNGSAYWTTALIALLAILVKLIPGGMGRNRFNPAVTGRVIYLLFPWLWNFQFTQYMRDWFGLSIDNVTTASMQAYVPNLQPDAYTTVTPLIFNFRNAGDFSGAPSLWNLFIGNTGGWGGAIGETSTLLILIAGVYLVLRRIIDWKTPTLFIGTVAIYMLIYGGFDFEFMMYHLLSGALVFAAVFMVTDYPTSGLTQHGKLIMPIGTGLLVGLFRTSGFSPEGVGLAIVTMNAIMPYVDRMLLRKIYGHDSRPFLGMSYNDREPLKKYDPIAEK